MAGPEDRVGRWEDKWATNNIGFHIPSVNPHLQQWYPRLADDDTPATFLVPLCGKSLDMIWLYNKGHTVIGIEAVEKAIVDFFTENNLEFTKSAVEGGILFQTSDGRLRLYRVDICEARPQLVGPVQAVWDRGSYVALNRADRTAYCRFIRGALAPAGRWLLWAVEYDTSRYAGPPHALPESEIRDDLEPHMDLECLNRRHRTADEWAKLKNWNLETLEEVVYLITPK